MKVRLNILALMFFVALAAWLLWPPAGRVAPLAKKPSSPAAVALAPAAPVAATNAAVADAGRLSAAVTNRLAFRLANTTRSAKELSTDSHAVLLENAFIDTRAKLDLKIPAHLQAAAEPGAFIVQARGAIDAGFRTAIAGAGGKIVAYIPNNALLVQLSASSAQTLAGHARVQAVLPYEPYYKVQSTLLGLAVNQKPLPTGTYLTLGLFGDGAATVAQLEKLGARIMSKDRSPFGSLVRVRPPPDWIALANLPGVQLVEPAYLRKAANDLARVAVGVNTNTTDGATNNYLGLTGKNVLVEVNDTGVDPNHPDLTGRVFGDSGGSLTDTDGHGTHVAGIIAADGTESFTVTNASGSVTNANFRGKAPAAKLFSVGGIAGGHDTNFFTGDSYLQESPALTNALISNNSWGYGGDTAYDLAAASYDAAVRDALPEDTGPQPVLFVFAAGNDGGGNDSGSGGVADSVSSPGTAKNVVTVGALEALRNITNVVTAIDGTSNAIWSARTDSGFQVAGYSSRGNVGVQSEGDFGRFKPDVVAPGTFTISTRSTQWDQQKYYNRTNYHQTIVGDFVTPDTLAYGFVTVPQNAVGVTLQVVPVSGSTNYPIYVSSTGVPDPADNTTYDFVKNNGYVSIPPDGGGSYLAGILNGGFIYAVGDPSTNQSLSFNVIETVITTNDFGNEFEVLSNLNNTVGPYYRYESGTSMATPVVSGVLALMQDFFTNTLHLLPSPALLKAMTINGARLTGNYKFAVTNTLNYEGWGLVQLPNSIPAALTNAAASPTTGVPLFFVDQSPTNSVATGDRRTWNVNLASVAARQQPLRVTLAWTDPPGNPAAAIKLVNDLDLIVTNLESGQVFYGNQFSGNGTPPFSAPGSTNTVADNINNVENIFLAPSLGTNYSITVFGHAVNVNAVTLDQTNVVQDFALVVACGDGSNTNGFTVASSAVQLAGVAAHIDFLPATNGIYFNQFAGANAPWLSTNDVDFGANNPYSFYTNSVFHAGQTNQWHFYVVTNLFGPNFTNAAFIVFNPNTAAIPRQGVFASSDANSTRPEADLEVLVSTAPLASAGNLTNLDLGVISNCLFSANGCGSAIGREGTEFVAFTNSQPNQIYYIGVQCQDQTAGQFGFIPVFTDKPFSTEDTNGNVYVNGFNVPVNIPDGNNAHPGVGRVFGLALKPVQIKRVIVTNTFNHENFGDLFGALSHGGKNAVLNNHDGLGAVNATQPFIYDDSVNGGTVNALHADGPGSLNDFRGKPGVGLWQLTEVDDAFSQTGRVQNFQIKIEPHKNLRNQPFTVVVVPAGGWFYDFVDVPAGYTNLLVLATNISPSVATPSIQLFVKAGDLPTLADTNYMATLNSGVPPGGSVSVGPPLTPNRYFVGIYNPSASDQTVLVGAILSFSATAIVTVDFPSQGGGLNILDDAVTYDSIFVTSTQAVQNFNVGLRVDHERISDLVFHLITPAGARYLLMENRGGQSTNGCGVTVITTNLINATANGNALADTNTFNVGITHGTFPITYNFYTAPDEMTVYYGTNVSPAYLIYDTGLTNNPPLGPGPVNTQPATFIVNFPPPGISADSTYLTIVMNQYGNTNRRTAWTYTAGGVLTNYAYLAFTEDTSLTQTPIKFAVPPFLPVATTNIYYGTNYTYTTNLNAVTNLVYTTNVTYVTNVSFIATNTALSGFESSTVTTYGSQSTVDGWSVNTTNQVDVVSDPADALAGSRFLTLANGVLSRNLSTPIGSTNTVSFIYRGPGAVGWWRGENNALDSAVGNDGYLTNGANYNGSGKVGSTFALSGASQFVAIPQTASLNVTGRVSVEFWMNPYTNNAMNSFQGLVTSDNYLVSIDVGNPNLGVYGLDFGINDNGTYYETANANGGGARITAGVWHHIVGVYDSTKLQLYVDGAAAGSATSHSGSIKPMTAGHYVCIGSENGRGIAGRNYSGLIDEASVYNRNLSLSEIKAIYLNGAAGKFGSGAAAPLNLAKASIALTGVTTNILFGANTNWQTNTITFVATASSTPFKLSGLAPGMLVDAFALTGNIAVTNIIPVATNVVITTNILPIIPANIPMLAGPIQYTNNSHYYCLFQSTNWTISEAWSVACGGHLVTVEDVTEHNWVWNTFKSYGGVNRDLWIGLDDTAGDTTTVPATHAANFFWGSGSTSAYRNWYPGEPNNGGGVVYQYFGFMDYFYGGLWEDGQDLAQLPGKTEPQNGVAELPAITTEIITNVFFTTNIVVTTSNLYYLPEQDISGIQTLNPYGLWKLEILDNRAGGGLTNSLVSWQMEFQYANTNITELPVLPTLATNYSVIETTLFTVTNTATYSVSNATLIYTVTGATNASISTNGIITWTPTESQGPGTFFLVTTVRDAANPLVVSQNFFQVDVLESNLPPVLTFPTTNTVFRILETVPWTTNATATDLDIPTNTLTFALVGMTNSFGVSVTGLSITPDGIINWQPVETNGPSTNFVFITVTDFNANNPVNTNSFTVTNSFTIIVLESNLPPVLILPPNTNLVELVSWTAQATAVDNDWPTNQLTFTLASGPSGLAVSPSGLIAWTPNELQGPGDYIVAISVTDTNPWAINQQSFTVSGTFIIHVDEWNIAPTLPTLPDTNTFELQTLTVNNAATDPDAPFNTLTYTLLVSPLDTNAPPVTNAFISVNGIITWIPTEAQGPGDYLFTTIVTDTNPPAINSTSFSATNSFIVHVLETNSAPFWVTNYPAVVMDELTVTNIFATALDTDLPPNILTYSLATNTPPWVTINSSNGLITLAPGEAAGPSTNTFTAIVTDNGAPPLSATTNFTVIVNEVNTAPFWATNVPSQTNYVVFEQTLLTVTNTASDADIPTNGLTYVLSVVSTNLGAPAVTNAAIDTNGVITWMPTEAQGPGIYIFTTIMTDTNPWALINQSFSATNYFTVTVLETNSAPFWVTNYPAVVMDELTVTNIAATALDADLPTNTLTFTLATNTPIWVSINPTNGLITLAPGEADGPSTNTFTVIVTDDGVPALNATTNFTVIVNEVNTAPFWTNAYPNVVLNTLDVTNVFGSATDTDLPPNTLTYSLSNAPAFVSINPGSGVITLTPGLSDGPSSNTVTVIVTDNGVPPLSAVTNFTVIVNSSIITLGGSNDARGVGIKYLNGSVYICGDSTATGGFLADFSLPLTANQTPLWNTNWPSANPNDALNAITASTNGVYAAGPNYTRTTDSAGGKEVKGLVVKYPLGGSIGGGFGGDLWDRQTPAAPGAFSYGGGEGLNGITLASENGINYLYACGNSQSGGANGGRFYLSKLAEDSTVLWTQTDGAEQVGVQFSAGEAVTVLNTNLYAAGVLNGQPYLRQYTPTGALIWKRTHTLAGAYLGITAAANYLYAVGYANVAGTNTDFLIDKWDEAGNLVWSRTYDRNTAQDQLNAAVNFNDRIFAVGYTYGQTAGGADAVILEIDPLTGSLLTTNLVGGSRDDKANGVDTDRTNLYVIGETRSFNNGTNQAMLFTFTPQLPTLVIGTPVTNIVAPGSINWYQVNVPTNAIAASNALLFATLPVNLWYSTNVPPSIFGPGAAELLTNSTGGTNVIATVNTFPLLVPGGIYFLGVQNTNSLAVTNAIQVTFAYEPPTLVIDDPVTNVVAPGSINWFRVNVPTNADFATNFLLFATAPVNLWYSSNTPPSITGISDFEMLANSTSGLYVMNTNTAPLLVPGSHYYLGVQNTNNFAVTNAIKVKFHLRTAAPPVPPSYTIYSIVQTTNAAGTNGFLLTWFAPTNTQFHLQWTPQLVPINWKEFKGVISFDSYISATNSHFSYFDDGDTNRGSAPFGFSRFYRLHLLNSPTNTAPEFSLAPTNYNVDSSVAFVVTNTARDWDLPAQTLFYRVTNSLSGTNYTTITNGVITWTPDVTQSGLTNFITTIVADSGTPTQRATNVVAVVVRAVPMFSAITIATNGVSLRWNAPTNQQFNVRWTTNLVPVIAWTLFPNTITSLTGTFTFTDTNAPFAMKFYQLILLP